MIKQIFELTDKIRPNAQFFRLLTLLVLATVIISRFPWMNGLLARVVNIPDIRHSITYQSIDNGATLIKIEIANVGQLKADNVLFHFQSRNGEISSFFVESQDNYEIQQEDLENAILNIKLTRLAPGAEIYVEITGYVDETQTFVSVTSDQGSSRDTDSPSFAAQVEGYATSMTSLYDRTTILIQNNLPFDEQRLTTWGKEHIVGFPDLVSFFKSDDFRTILSATFVLSLLIGLFLPHLAWLIPIIAAIGIGLLANFRLSLGFIIVVSIITILPGLPRSIKTTYSLIKNDPKNEWSTILFWIALFLSPLYFWNTAVSARWLALPTIMIVLYILLLVSIIIPAEPAQQTISNNEHRLVIQTEQSPLQDDASLENLHATVAQITEYVGHVEQQLSDLQLLVSQLSQKYSALIKVVRKGETKEDQENKNAPPSENA